MVLIEREVVRILGLKVAGHALCTSSFKYALDQLAALVRHPAPRDSSEEWVRHRHAPLRRTWLARKERRSSSGPGSHRAPPRMMRSRRIIDGLVCCGYTPPHNADSSEGQRGKTRAARCPPGRLWYHIDHQRIVVKRPSRHVGGLLNMSSLQSSLAFLYREDEGSNQQLAFRIAYHFGTGGCVAGCNAQIKK